MTTEERLLFDPTPVSQWVEPVSETFPWLSASLATLAAAAVLLAIYCCVSKRDATPEPMEYEGDDR